MKSQSILLPMRLLALVWLYSSVAFPSPASANSGHIVISELQSATAASASQEFIELYNAERTDTPLAGWSLEYKSASSADIPANWNRKAVLSGVIKGYGFYLAAPKTYIQGADADWSSTLSGSGGVVRLKDASGAIIDQVAYAATALGAEGGKPAPAPAPGQSIERLPGRLDELSGNGTDTDNNAADFIIRNSPQPQSTISLIEVASEGGYADPPPIEVDPLTDTPPPAESYAPVEISELLVNPMSPLTDAQDEFIELFNPNDAPVDLKGYTLKGGSNFKSYFILPSQVIAPGEYFAVYSRQTHISLTNSGGSAEILDPTGAVVSVAPVYGPAPEGQAWARFEDGWHWSLQTTPGRPNILATAVVLQTAAKAKAAKVVQAKPKNAAVKKPLVKKAGVKKTVTHPKKSKIKKHPLTAKVASSRNLQLASWLLISLAVLTIVYAIYEFRYDLQRLYHVIRRNPNAGSEIGPTPQGRRGDRNDR